MNKVLSIVVLVLVLVSIVGINYSSAQDCIKELNAQRARRGLRLYKRDENLSRAAEACSKYRAKYLISDHVSYYVSNGTYHKLSDFYFLPRGLDYRYNTIYMSGGCAAWPLGLTCADGDTFGSCCKYDNYIYAGAWTTLGRDGRRYMHLFVR